MSAALDVLVIGGGLVGASLAYGLLRAGRAVTILDGGDTDFRASRANFGLVALQSKGMGMPAYSALSRQSSELWPSFAAELREITGIEVRYRVRGGFTLALSEADLAKRRDFVARLNGQPGMTPLPTVFLDRSDLLQINRELGPDVVGASHCPLDGDVDVLRFYRALHEAVAALGGRFVPNRPARRVSRDGDGLAVETDGGFLRAQTVVLAAGLGNQQLALQTGIDLQLRPDPGTILVTERTEPFLEHVMGSMRQMAEGTVLIGGSPPGSGFDTDVHLGALPRMARRATRIFPRLAGVQMVRSWTGLRILTKDGFPIYEQSPALPGVFACACHSGVTLAALHAAIVAPMIAAGAIGPALEAFTTRRYDVQQAA
jgi:hydrogen cyanide synthase HcnC